MHVKPRAARSCTLSSAGLTHTHVQPWESTPSGLGLAVADFNADGLLDIFVPNYSNSQLITGLNGDFVDRSEWLGTASMSVESTSSVDYDADGDLDIFLGTVNGSYLLINEGRGQFSDVLPLSDKESWTTGGTWGDVNADGSLDLLICNHALRPPTAEELSAGTFTGGDGSELLLSDQKGGFIDASERIASVGKLYPNTCLMQDLDNDQDLDLYFVNDFGPWTGPNAVLWNDGSGFFEEEPRQNGLDVTVMGMGVAVTSVDANPLPSLLISSWGEMKFVEPIGDQWIDSTAARGFGLDDPQRVAWGVALVDMDNDSDQDAAVTFGELTVAGGADFGGLHNPKDQPDALFWQDEGSFAQGTARPLNDPRSGRGLVAADLDRNGSMDLVIQDIDDGTHIYLNGCPTQHWVRVSLEQAGPNPNGIASRVELDAGGKTQIQWLHAGGTSMASSGPAELHFGLGKATRVEEIRVIWPDGAQSRVQDQPADRELHLVRD
jgi:hypothetical protein